MFIYLKEHLKKPLAGIILLSLLFQFFPAPQKAQAFDFGKFIKDIMKGVQVPQEMVLTEKGNIEFRKSGNAVAEVFGLPIMVECIPCLIHLKKADRDKCMGTVGKCVNPFSTLSLGEDKIDLVNASGQLAIPYPKYDDFCKLKIETPQYPEISRNEEYAGKEACSYYRRLQLAASQQVYGVKKIFNATDPLSDCFFLRNCKSKCFFKFGEIKYTITLIDIAEMLLPTGWLTAINKILNVLKVVGKVKEIVDMGASALKLGAAFLNDVLANVKNLKMFFSALGNILQVDDDGGLSALLTRFSDNLLALSTAKSEAFGQAGKTSEKAVEISQKIKSEKELEFLFNVSSVKRQEIQKITQDYLAMFKSISGNLDAIIQAGTLPESADGQDVFWENRELVGGVMKGQPISQRSTGENKPVWQVLAGGWLGIGQETQTPEKNKWICRKVENGSIITPIDGVLDCSSEKAACWVPGRVIPYGECVLDIGNPLSSVKTIIGCNWLPKFKNTYTLADAIRVYLDPDYVIEVVDRALNGSNKEGRYTYDTLNYTKAAWRNYWESLGNIIMGSAWVQDTLAKNSMLEAHRIIMQNCVGSTGIKGLPSLGEIAFIEAEGRDMRLKDSKQWVDFQVARYKKVIEKDYPKMADSLDDEILAIQNNATSLFNYSQNLAYSQKALSRDNQYWKDARWCSNTLDDEDISKEATKLFDKSYNSDIANTEWNPRVMAMARADLTILKKALELRVPPQEPILNYLIKKAGNDLNAVLGIDALLETAKQQVGVQCLYYENTVATLEKRAENASIKYEKYKERCKTNDFYCADVPICKDWYDAYQLLINYYSQLGTKCRTITAGLTSISFGGKFGVAVQDLGKAFEDLTTSLKVIDEAWRKANDLQARDSVIAGEYLNDLIATKQEAQKIVNAIIPNIEKSLTALENSIAGADFTSAFATIDAVKAPSNNQLDYPDEVCHALDTDYGKSNANLEKEKNAVKQAGAIIKKAIEDSLKKGLSVIRNEIIAMLKEKTGKYVNCPANGLTSEKGFLNQLSCFEKRNGKTIEELLNFIYSLKQLEEVVYQLVESPQSAQVDIQQLEPKIRMENVQIKNSDDEKWSLMAGTEEINRENFTKKLLEDPLSYLQDIFTALTKMLDNIRGPLLSDPTTGAKAYLVLGLNDNARMDSYNNQFSDLDKKLIALKDLIFGDDALRNSCSALQIVFDSPVLETEQRCKDKSQGGEIDKALLANNVLAGNCALWNKITPPIEKLNCQAVDGLYCLNLEIIKAKDSTAEKEYNNKPVPGFLGGEERTCAELKPIIVNDPGRYQPVFDQYCLPFLAQMESNKGLLDLQSKVITAGMNEESFKALINQCDSLAYQKSLQSDCLKFAILRKALSNDCNDLEGKDEETPCVSERCQCSQLRRDMRAGIYGGTNNKSLPQDLAKESNKDKLNEAQERCDTELGDIKTPLREVMDVYSFLIGVRSGTLAYRGIKTSVADFKKFYSAAEGFINAIKSGTEEAKKQWNAPVQEGGFSINVLDCVSAPAQSQQGNRVITGPNGGMVCPGTENLFSGIDANFSIARQNLSRIDAVRRDIGWQDFLRLVAGRAPIVGEQLAKWLDSKKFGIKYASINPLYNRAEKIKQKAQYVWALSTAIDFANQNCTCGQSYCKMPVCLSGAPLTLAPLEEPYCYLVFILRHQLLKQANDLEQLLKQ